MKPRKWPRNDRFNETSQDAKKQIGRRDYRCSRLTRCGLGILKQKLARMIEINKMGLGRDWETQGSARSLRDPHRRA